MCHVIEFSSVLSHISVWARVFTLVPFCVCSHLFRFACVHTCPIFAQMNEDLCTFQIAHEHIWICTSTRFDVSKHVFCNMRTHIRTHVLYCALTFESAHVFYCAHIFFHAHFFYSAQVIYCACLILLCAHILLYAHIWKCEHILLCAHNLLCTLLLLHVDEFDAFSHSSEREKSSS